MTKSAHKKKAAKRAGANRALLRPGATALQPRSGGDAAAPQLRRHLGDDAVAVRRRGAAAPQPRSGGGAAQSSAKEGKAIRRELDAGNLDAALAMLRRPPGSLPIDAATRVAAMLACCGAYGRLGDAVALAVTLPPQSLPLKVYASMLAALPLRTRVSEALALATAAEPLVKHSDANGRAYFTRWTRLLLMERFAESWAALERIAARSRGGWGQAATTMLDIRAAVMPGKAAQLVLTPNGQPPRFGGAGYGGGGVGDDPPFRHGDTLLLQAATPSGDSGLAAPLDAAAPLFAPVAFPGGIEAEVTGTFPELTVRVASAAVGATLRAAGCLRADAVANRVTAARQLDALAAFAGGDEGTAAHPMVDPVMRAIVLGVMGATVVGVTAAGAATTADLCDAPPDTAGPERLSRALAAVPATRTLNASQRAALTAALTRRLTLIQGPPGTGKTATAVSIVRAWLSAGAGPVYATSDSNTAVDNLLAGMAAAGLRVVRVGRPEAVRPDLLPFALDFASGARALPGTYTAAAPPKSRDEQRRLMRETLKYADVVCATTSGAGSDTFEALTFRSVLVDEAAQATEPAVLVALCNGAQRVALVGDHAQLPPTVISSEAEAGGLAVPLFTRLVEAGVRPLLLDVQYRMHPALAHFPSHRFYGGAVRSGVTAAARPPPTGFYWPQRGVGLAFVDVASGREASEGTSYVNAAEGDAVCSIVRALLSSGDGLRAEDIGIVTPYAAQVRLLRRVLGPLRGRALPGAAPPLEVGSVDGFQGREKEVIVFSAVRTGVHGNVGFLADTRRLNVMLTRARRGLIIIGSVAALRGELKVWAPWLAWAEDAGLVIGSSARVPSAAAALLRLDACPHALADSQPGGGRGGSSGGIESQFEPLPRLEQLERAPRPLMDGPPPLPPAPSPPPCPPPPPPVAAHRNGAPSRFSALDDRGAVAAPAPVRYAPAVTSSLRDSGSPRLDREGDTGGGRASSSDAYERRGAAAHGRDDERRRPRDDDRSDGYDAQRRHRGNDERHRGHDEAQRRDDGRHRDEHSHDHHRRDERRGSHDRRGRSPSPPRRRIDDDDRRDEWRRRSAPRERSRSPRRDPSPRRHDVAGEHGRHRGDRSRDDRYR